MGSNSSKPCRILKVGHANYAARGIYALYGLTDKNFPYNINLPRILSDEVILDRKLEAINLEISRKIEKNYIEKKHTEEKDTTITVRNIIANGKKIEPVFYNQALHGDHMIMCKENIFEICDEIGELDNLQLLQMCCNYIYKIPKSITNLQKLTTLSLARNQIRNFPDEICELTNLTHLDLSFNFISDIPQNLKDLKALTTLHLENNLFNEIPLEISKLKSLRNLQFANNPIRNVPLQVLRMPFLIEFDATSTTLVYENLFKKVGRLDLRELCVRNLINHTLSVYKIIDRLLLESLFNIEECGFCGGPIFEAYFLIKTCEYFETKEYPVKYKICRKHFTNQRNRIGAFFGKSHPTIPYNILIKYNLNVKDIFNSSSLIKKRHKLYGIFSRKMHLWNLAKLNNQQSRKILFKKVDFFLYN